MDGEVRLDRGRAARPARPPRNRACGAPPRAPACAGRSPVIPPLGTPRPRALRTVGPWRRRRALPRAPCCRGRRRARDRLVYGIRRQEPERHGHAGRLRGAHDAVSRGLRDVVEVRCLAADQATETDTAANWRSRRSPAPPARARTRPGRRTGQSRLGPPELGERAARARFEPFRHERVVSETMSAIRMAGAKLYATGASGLSTLIQATSQPAAESGASRWRPAAATTSKTTAIAAPAASASQSSSAAVRPATSR